MRSPLALLLFLLTLGLVPATAQDGFRPIFNGKDLAGWDGNPDLWTVEDGAITGRTKGPDHLAYNQFLIWRGGEPRNFELRAKIKQSGNNSGIQYRSKEFPDVGKWAVGGYQCDIHPNAGYNGMVYEERGRGIVVQNGQGVIVDDKGAKWLVSEHEPVKVDVAEWHEYTVIAQGNHLIHKIDGKVTIDLVDHDAKARSLGGIIALQVHRGPAMVVQVKDIMIKELPEGGLLSPETNPIPSDAHRIEAPGAKAAPKAAGTPAPKAKGKAAEKGKAPAAKAGPKKDPNAGLAIGENKATPVDRIKVPKGFKVELLYSVPGSEQGSWVALCHDDKGRIYASDQYGALYRFPAPAAGQPLDPATIQKMPVEVRAINGMVWAFGALYAGVNDYEQKIPSGLYRLTSSKGDDLIDKAELLNEFKAGSDHGVHAVLPTPDGKSLFLVCGNNAVYHGSEKSSPVPRTWGDDHLLPRMPDGRGHNRHVLAPGGIVYRVSPDGKKLEVYASGFRNIYDAALNRDGELFTYDADMEYDFNTSWYRPTRINHVVSGAEYGWRNGAGKYPEFYADNLPATLNIGPGSPTGTTFGYGAKFPLKYREALFALDWSWGKIYAVHLEPDGASYKAKKEEFLSGAPLPVTDAIILPKDGAMYFAIGGRKVQSGLYRVTYPGFDKLQEPQIAAAVPTPETQLRHQLEAFHGRQDPAAVAFAWPHLSHADRFVRWAARIVLEHQPVAEWQAKALAETDPTAQLEAFYALAHVTSTCPSHRTPESPNLTAPRDAMLAALLKYDWAKLSETQRLAYVRLIEVILHRSAEPVPADTLAALVAKLDPVFPAASFELNWELIETLAYLQAPNTAAKGMALVAAAPSQEPQIEYMRSLRMLKAGWTPELRKAQLEWFLKAANYRGGSSFAKFIEFIRNDSLATFTDAEKQQHAELIARKPVIKSAIENVGAMFAGRTPRNWTLEELTEAARTGLKDRDFENGRKMFGAAACFACHRFGNAGGMTGPDLTQAGGRYSPHDFLDQILNPSKEINEQFAPIIVTKNNGDILSGVVVNLNGDRVTLNTDLSDPDQRVDIDRKEVKSIELSKVSPMPPMLLSMLTKEEILDLVAFVLSGGDKENAMFRK